MTNHTTKRDYEGTLLTASFGDANVEQTTREEYQRLLEEHDSEDVLVITGATTSADTFRMLC